MTEPLQPNREPHPRGESVPRHFQAASPRPVNKAAYAAAAFVTLLLLSVFWPSPVVSANRLWIKTALDVDGLSFLGREAPQWDVVYWFFAGVLALAIVISADSEANLREPLRQLRAWRLPRTWRRHAGLALIACSVLTAVAWLFLDTPVVIWAERIQSETTEDVIRILNRLGGGMNPVMLAAFFLIAGVAYCERRWVAIALSMGAAGLGAGILAQILKHLVGRARPELWLGPTHYAPGSLVSFPSGHTAGAFALAGVLVFASKSWPLRFAALLLAAGVGLSRVLAFRHWTSDVTASAVIGLAFAWIATRISLPHAAER
jgi:membrane-associated phospholipid phosphatase